MKKCIDCKTLYQDYGDKPNDNVVCYVREGVILW